MLFKPDYQFEKITDITPKKLKQLNIEGLILDVDNTLCTKKGENILPGVLEWLDIMRNNNIKTIILSNAKPKRMSPIAKKFDLDFVSLGLKPLPFGFFEAAKRMGVKRKNIGLIGDQLFTDILGGNLSGNKTFLVTPTEMETSFGFKIKRGLERKLLKKYGLKCDF